MPKPMLARTGDLPTGPYWSFEVKWDGFRALVSTEQGLSVQSRRGRDMTPVLPELQGLPRGIVVDGELLAWRGGEPYFPLVCRRVLNADLAVPVTLVIFDLLRRDGVELTHWPYSERRRELATLALDGPAWITGETFSEGQALFSAVCELGLEGVVAKKLSGRYRPGVRGWVKVKNPSYRRRDEERDAVARSMEHRAQTRL